MRLVNRAAFSSDRLWRRLPVELYDLDEDPLGLPNLANRPEHRARVDDSVERLERSQADTADPWLHKWSMSSPLRPAGAVPKLPEALP